MAGESFKRDLTVAVDRSQTWTTITDVATVVGWVAAVRDATVIVDMDSYRATLADRVGMFTLTAELEISVTEHTELSRVVLHAEGEDRQVASRILVDAEVVLTEQEGGTRVEVAGTYEVSGKVATLGAGTIRKKADRILNEFFASLEQELS